MQPNKLEARGVRCLECTALDLKAVPEATKNGSGQCTRRGAIFVSFEMARNCWYFDAAPIAVVTKREQWAERLPPRFPA